MLGSVVEEVGRGSTFRTDFKDGWVEAHQKAREILEGVQKYDDMWKRTTIYEVGDVVLKKNNAGVLGSSKKLNPVWKDIKGVNKIMSEVLLEIKNSNKVCVIHDTLKKCGDSDLPR